MGRNIFFISDLHLGHANMINFTRADGKTKVRDFVDLTHMHDHMVDRWNSVVREQDHVYILGDVVMNKSGLPVLDRMNGHKRIVMGNHDIMKSDIYLQHVEKLCGVRVMKGAVLTHVPVHPHCLNDRSWKVNIHGHLHTNHITLDGHKPDKRYVNVCCEQLDYVPISIEELREKIWNLNIPGVNRKTATLEFY